MYCGLQSRGKGVGLQPLCAREEEWVPGDVILTGRGQLSQYNRLQEKRSHRKTENTKPSPAIFSPIWHRQQPQINEKLSILLHLSSSLCVLSLSIITTPTVLWLPLLHEVYQGETQEITRRGESRRVLLKVQKTKLAKYHSKCFRYWRNACWNLVWAYLYYSCYPKTWD